MRGEGLENVVELGGGEVDGYGLVSTDLARVLEEAYAVFVERDAGDWKLRGGRGMAGGDDERQFSDGASCVLSVEESWQNEKQGRAGEADRSHWEPFHGEQSRFCWEGRLLEIQKGSRVWVKFGPD